MESNMDSSMRGYDLSHDHPGYSLPVSNIPYHVYSDDNGRTDNTAVAQKAFQRIMDSYDEYEKMADVFQVELDRRQQLVKVRKQQEKTLREERQRQLKEDRRTKRQGKAKAASAPSLRTVVQPFHPYRAGANHAGVTPTDFRRRSFAHRTLGRQEQGLDDYGLGFERASLFATSSTLHSHSDPPPHLTHATERSPSSSPVLPLTPSPRLGASDSAFGLAASALTTSLPESAFASATSSSSSSAIAFSLPGSSSSSPSKPFAGPQHHQPLCIRRKRKQAIPVHPSVVDRIPGITLRIQPDAAQHLQVEILKNVEDYQLTKDVAAGGLLDTGDVHNSCSQGEPMSQADHQAHDESNNFMSESFQRLQSKQDRDKIQESIASGRPSYTFFPSSTQHLLLPLERDLDRESMLQDVSMRYTPTTTPGYQKHHQRQSSTSSGRSLEFYDPTTAWMGVPGTDHRNRSLSTSRVHSSVLSASNLSIEDIVASRAALPLSWDNFSTRDCQVNKVIGKHDKEFELLEEVVQEAVARQHAVYLSEDEIDSPEPEKAYNNSNGIRRVSHPSNTLQNRESSKTNVSAKGAGGRTPSSRKSNGLTEPLSEATPSRASGTRATRHGGGTKGLVQGYDNIEQILKAKRQKKREEKRRRQSEVRDTSEPATEDGHESDHELLDENDESNHGEHMDVDEESRVFKSEDGVKSTGLDLQKPSLPHTWRPMTLCTSELASRDDRSKVMQSEKENTRRKSTSQTDAPPSPPHSRQVTPCKVESTATSRRSSMSFSAHVRPVSYASAAPESDASSTPPATPTRATILPPPPPLFRHGRHHPSSSGGQQEPLACSETAVVAASSGGRTRGIVRSTSSSRDLGESEHIPEGKNQNRFFDEMLEAVAAKAREKRAKKKAAATSAVAVTTSNDSVENVGVGHSLRGDTNTDCDVQGEDSGGVKNALKSSSTHEMLAASGTVDPHALERELNNLESSSPKSAQELTAANLPKSSKFLPGRILRKVRTKTQDPLYVSEAPTTGSSAMERADVSQWDAEDSSMLDSDCTSCRLDISASDRFAWKQARQAGEIHLNSRRWGKTAILCVACRVQYQRHHLRCTQCFYVPVIAEDMVGRSGAPKAGGTCTRCKAGTWFQESDN